MMIHRVSGHTFINLLMFPVIIINNHFTEVTRDGCDIPLAMKVLNMYYLGLRVSS